MSKTAGAGIPENDLIRLIGEGQTELFETLIAGHVPKVYGLALRMTGNPADAEDVLQEACILAFSRLDTFRGQSSFGTWFYRIALNAIYTRFRRAKSRSRQSKGTYLPRFDETGTIQDAVGSFELDPEDAAIRSEVGAILESAIRRLPGDFRAVLIARDVDGLSTDETATALGLSAAAVKSRLHRGRLGLRRELERRFGRKDVVDGWLGSLSGPVRISGRTARKAQDD